MYEACSGPSLLTQSARPSNSVTTVSTALKDLSTRVVKAGRPKVVVKLMYDRGSWAQLWNAHAPVSAVEWKPLDLPDPEEIPGLELEVVVSTMRSGAAHFRNK